MLATFNSKFAKSILTSVFLALAAVVCIADGAMAVGRLDVVKERGYLNCGVSEAAPGFSEVDKQGNWRGLDVDFCSALAGAVFGDKSAVKFRAVPAREQFEALTGGDVDVLMGTASWTLSRDTEFGARFVDILYYDGVGFLAPRNHLIASVLELSGASVCMLPGSNSESAVEEFFNRHNMRYQPVVSERWNRLVQIYTEGGCTVLAGDKSLLAFERSRLVDSEAHALVPELISKEPNGPVVRKSDVEWFAIVRWVMMALISAEELGISSDNVGDLSNSASLQIRRFLGLEANLGVPLGLEREWAANVVRAVGNYGEMYERNLGAQSSLQLDRGLNKLARDGGLMYAAPLR